MRGLAARIIALTLWCAPAGAHDAPSIHPPEAIQRVVPPWPKGMAAVRDVDVVMLLTVTDNGAVDDVVVVQSGGPAFDAAAVEAVRQWRFSPARVDGVPAAVRVRLVQRFVAAPLDLGAAPPSLAPRPQLVMDAVAVAPASPVVTPPAQAFEQTVRAVRPNATRAASDVTLEEDVLRAAPAQDATDLMRQAAGVYISRPEGPAVAPEIFLRGFDAQHGQDIQLSVERVPINQPAHVHGQGYADVGFIIPEVVRSLRVLEGVFDPRQGDFAVAGSMDFALGVKERGFFFKTTAGSFGTLRAVAVTAPRDMDQGTFGAVALRTTQGFGHNRGAQDGQALGQVVLELPAGWRAVGLFGASAVRSNLAGILRADDVESARVGFYDRYQDPSAAGQNAWNARGFLSARVDRNAGDGAHTSAQGYAILTAFRLRQNYTGYLQRGVLNPDWVGRGDLQEQEQQMLSAGGWFSHRFARVVLMQDVHATLETGVQPRMDVSHQAISLLQAPQNETWDQRVDAPVRGSDLGAWVDVEVALTSMVRLRGGWRANVLAYDVDDRLANLIPAFRPQSHIMGYRRTVLGLAHGPRCTLELRVLPVLPLFVSYGEGYRSPQPLQLEEGEVAPFTKVRSVEGGLRLSSPGDGRRFLLTAAAYVTWLSQDLAFDPTEGRVEKLGPSSRRGVSITLLSRPFDWWINTVSVTAVHATLDAPPRATAEDPSPVYLRGQLLPYVPPVVVRGSTVVDRELSTLVGLVLRGRLGVTVSGLSSRPLPYGQYAAPILLVDAQAALRLGPVEGGVDLFNVFNSRYAQSEYIYTSNWNVSGVPTRVPARHVSAGAPRTVLFNVGVHL